MTSTPLRAAAIVFLAALFLAGNMLAQDKPDRPPWAQPKPKPKLPPNSSSADTVAPEPLVLPSPEPPASIVPTPEQPLRPSGDADAQRARIKVKVELVNILASVLDDHNRPAPDLPVEPHPSAIIRVSEPSEFIFQVCGRDCPVLMLLA